MTELPRHSYSVGFREIRPLFTDGWSFPLVRKPWYTGWQLAWQFSLVRLLLVVIVAAVFCGAAASGTKTYELSIMCHQMPKSDQQLLDWFAAQPGVLKVTVVRSSEYVVRVKYKQRALFRHDHFLRIPYADMGYGVHEGLGWESEDPFP